MYWVIGHTLTANSWSYKILSFKFANKFPWYLQRFNCELAIFQILNYSSQINTLNWFVERFISESAWSNEGGKNCFAVLNASLLFIKKVLNIYENVVKKNICFFTSIRFWGKNIWVLSIKTSVMKKWLCFVLCCIFIVNCRSCLVSLIRLGALRRMRSLLYDF